MVTSVVYDILLTWIVHGLYLVSSSVSHLTDGGKSKGPLSSCFAATGATLAESAELPKKSQQNLVPNCSCHLVGAVAGNSGEQALPSLGKGGACADQNYD